MYSAARKAVKLIPTYNSLPVRTLSPWWLAGLTLAMTSGSVGAAAQSLPSEPIVFGDGRVTIGAEVTGTFACTNSATSTSEVCSDDTGYFNYSDYQHSTLRMLRVDVSTAVKATERLSVLAEVRSEDGERVRPYALYVRLKPWSERAFDIQAGRVPPTFGAFARRTYPSDNLLIGYPLAYQYLTSLRPDALPANADELLRMQGRGWRSSFSVGNAAGDKGLPIASAFRWDTGVQVHGAIRIVDAALSVTTGSLANPLVGDDNGGKQVAGRVSMRPLAGLLLGVSASHSPYLTRAVTRAAGVESENRNYTQTAFGADVEYSRDYYLVRFETIVSDWRLPLVAAPSIRLPLRATSTLVEGRYKIRPGLYAAARLDHLGFSEITGTTRTSTWDAPVTRYEIGGGYSILRNVLLKGSFQYNSRPAGRTQKLKLGALQLVFWF